VSHGHAQPGLADQLKHTGIQDRHQRTRSATRAVRCLSDIASSHGDHSTGLTRIVALSSRNSHPKLRHAPMSDSCAQRPAGVDVERT
jgi:hypothetical protein